MKTIVILVCGMLLSGCQVRLFNDASVNDNSAVSNNVTNHYYNNENAPSVSHTHTLKVVPRATTTVYRDVNTGRTWQEFEKDEKTGAKIVPNFDRTDEDYRY